MAVQNNPYLYQLGNVKIDSTPSLNLYAQLQQRREAQRLAKEDAFQDYINNLNTKITPAGVRVADLPAFEQMKNDWVKFGMENKDKLKKNDIPTQTEFNQRYQRILNLATRSKAEEEGKKPAVEIITDPNKRYNTTDEFMEDLYGHDQPLLVQNSNGEWEENRERKRLDFTKEYFNPTLDLEKEFSGWSKGMKMGKTYSEKPIKSDPQSGTVTFATEEKFSPEQISQTANNAMKAAKEKGRVRNYFEHRLRNISDEDLQKANKAFQSEYGATTQYTFPNGNTVTGENIIDTPEELAAAEALIQANAMLIPGEELRLDKQLANQRAQVNISLNKGGAAETPVNDLYGQIDEKLSKFNPKPLLGVFGTSKFMPLNDLTVDAQKMILDYARDLTGATGGEKGIKYLNNESVGLKRDENGGIGIYDTQTKKYLGELPRVGTNIKVQADVKGKKEVVKQGEKKQSQGNYSIKGKTYTEKELLDMGYTLDDIKPYKQ